MAVTSFIPQIWNAQMLIAFRQQAIAAALVNRQYEGNASKGNTVKINLAADVAVKDYKTGVSGQGARTTAPDTVSSTSQDLLINQEKNFDFLIDDIDRAQAAGSMQAYTQLAGLGLATDADKFILTTAVGGAQTTLSGNSAATPANITTGDEAWNVVRDVRKALNKLHVPLGQRVLIVNAEFEALLLSATAKLTAWNTSGTTDGLRDATLGRLLGFTVFTSENLPTTSKASLLAFHQPSVAFVSQITETEAMRAQNAFSDRLRGLHVYGGKVIRPEGVVVWNNVS